MPVRSRSFARVGLHPVFFGETVIGSKMPNLTYMLSFESAQQMEENWQKFVKDPGWERLKAMDEYSRQEDPQQHHESDPQAGSLLANLMSTFWDVVVIGAGAAGLLAAARAAERGRRVLVLEKNTKPGVKILMSGGTRCNLTHAVDARGIVAAFGRQGSFLHSALAALSPDDVVALFEAEGVATKVEPGGKVFPASDRAFDVLAALRRRLERSGAMLVLREPVVEVRRTGDDRGFSIVTRRNATLTAAKLVLTTGGQSYPGCGTTGDGYAWAAGFGHTIVPPRPSLVPVTIRSEWAKSLSGVTIPDVQVRVLEGDKLVSNSEVTDALRAERRGSLLFAHFGLSGPVVLDVSRVVSSHASPGRLSLECDFLPDVRDEVLEKQMQDAASRQGKKQVAAILRRMAAATTESTRCWRGRRVPASRVVRGTQPRGTHAASCRRSSRRASRSPAPWDSRKPKSRPAA